MGNGVAQLLPNSGRVLTKGDSNRRSAFQTASPRGVETLEQYDGRTYRGRVRRNVRLQRRAEHYGTRRATHGANFAA